MKAHWKIKLLATAATLALALPVFSAQADKDRIITVGSSSTELVFALGAGDKVIAVDSTSTQPAKAIKNLPKVGYHRALSTEGILSMKPTQLIGSDDMGPPPVIAQLRQSGLKMNIMPVAPSLENLYQRIDTVAGHLNHTAEGEKLKADIEAKIDEARRLSKGKKPRVMFLLLLGNSPMIAGSNTTANSLIELIGGENVAAKSFPRYKKLSGEAVIAMQPDLILFSGNGKTFENDAVLKLLPGLASTPAGQNKKLKQVDGTLLVAGFGPRIGDAVLDLVKQIHQTE